MKWDSTTQRGQRRHRIGAAGVSLGLAGSPVGCRRCTRAGWQDRDMLHVRVTAPAGTAARVVELARADPTVANVIQLPGQVYAQAGDGDSAGATTDEHGGGDGGALVLFDVARENASHVLEQVRALGVEAHGSLAATDSDVLFSAAAERAERAAPGDPEDAVVWDEIEEQAGADAGWTWSFLTFLVLATLIAGIGRYLDQPILIVGAMVVGPEFAPVSACCIGLARRMPRVIWTAATTLCTGFAVAAALATVFWWLARLLGTIDAHDAAAGPQTRFIVQPNVWSLVIALLAGAAGVLSLTSRKSSALVGVFISVTTVPAAGTLALAVANGLWGQAGQSVVQLAVNIAGMIAAGTLTLLIQAVLWRRAGSRRSRRRRPSSGTR